MNRFTWLLVLCLYLFGTAATAVEDVRVLTADEAKARHAQARRHATSLVTLGLGKDRVVTLRGWTDALLGLANDDRTAVAFWRDDAGLRVEFAYPITEAFRANRATYNDFPLRYFASADSPAIFQDDCVEVQIRPSPTGPLFHFAVNGLGAAFDARDGDIAWNGRWKPEVKVDDHFWLTRMTIPWADLGGAPAEGAAWGINVYHRAVHLEQHHSVWAFTGVQRPMLGTLRFRADAPGVTISKQENPAYGTVALQGKVTGEGAVTVQAEVFPLNLITLSPDDEFSKKDDVLPPGWTEQTAISGKGTFSWQTTLSRSMAGDVLFMVRDALGAELIRHARPFVYAVSWDVLLSPLPSADRLIVELDAGSEGAVAGGLAAEISITTGKGEPVGKPTAVQLTRARQACELTTKHIPAGECRVETRFISGGVKAPPIIRTFVKPETPVWAGNTIGISEKVPEPWVPVKRVGDALEVWGRRIDFAHNLLPSRITILDEELLAQPMRLVVQADGQTHTPQPAAVSWGTQTDRRVELAAQARAGNLTVRTESWVEFDGFIWVTVKLQGKGTVERLALEVPFTPQQATHWINQKFAKDASATGLTPAEPFTGNAHMPTIGSEDRALQMCWESQQGWNLREPRKAFEFIPGQQVTLARLIFIDTPTAIDGERTIQFGLQPLPVKPFPPAGWRDIWWFGPWKKAPPRPMLTTTQWNGEWWWPMKHWNYPNLSDERLAEIRQGVKHGLEHATHFHAFYHNDINTDANTSEYRIYGEEWRSWPAPRPDFSVVEGKPDKELVTQVCYNADSYQEFYLYHTRRYLQAIRGEEGLPVSIYIDCSGPNHCSNPYHGCGWIDEDGERKSHYNIIAQRRYMQRLYQMFREDLGKNAWISVHMSWTPLMAVWGYADMMMPGEEYAAHFAAERARFTAEGTPNPYSYIPYITMARMRAEHNPWRLGATQGFLQQLYCLWTDEDREEMKRDPNALTTGRLKAYTAGLHHFTALTTVHDCLPWGGSEEEPLAIRTKFKLDDSVRFHGYWRNHDLLTLDIYDPERYVVSMYTRPERFLLLAFNNTDTETTGTVTLNLDKFGFPQAAGAELLDLLDGTTVPLQGNRAAFTMPPRRLRLLMYGTPWDWQSDVKSGAYQPW
jgi:hypothetical protein